MREKSRIEGMRIAFRKRSVIFGEEQSEQRAGLQGMGAVTYDDGQATTGAPPIAGFEAFYTVDVLGLVASGLCLGVAGWIFVQRTRRAKEV